MRLASQQVRLRLLREPQQHLLQRGSFRSQAGASLPKQGSAGEVEFGPAGREAFTSKVAD